MLKWIRWWGIIVIAALVLLVWAVSWLAVKPVLEWVGTKAVGAQVAIDEAHLSWFPLGLSVQGLHVANPDNPQRHWVEAGHINAAIDTYHLLRHSLVADEVSVTGLRFNTPRAGGAPVVKKDKKGGSFELSIPGLDLPDVSTLVDQQVAAAQAELTRLENDMKAIETRWDGKIKSLPDEDKIKEYKARIKAAKKENVLVQLQTLKTVKEEVSADLKTIKSMRKDLNRDVEKVRAEIDAAKTLPKRQVQLAMKNLGIDSGDIAMARQLLSSYLMPLIENLKSDKKANAEAEKPARGRGEWISFSEYETYPSVLVRKVLVDGEFTLTSEPLTFSGQITDIANEPKRWKNPLRLDLSGASQKLGSVALKGLFDHRLELGKDKLNIDANKLAIAKYTIADSDALQWLLNKGLMSLKGELSLTGNALGGDLKGQFDQLDFVTTVTSDKKLAKALATAIESVNQFGLDAALGGTLEKPAFNVKSNLDSLLGASLKSQLKAELQPYKEKLQAQLTQKLSGPLASLDQYKGLLGEYDSVLDQRKQALEESISKL